MENKNLVIVAHPDDETIWMGGTILKNINKKWVIISLCRKNDNDRMPKFLKVCEIYNAKAIISDLDDESLFPIEIKDVEDKIISLINEYSFDYIYTHGENGEYGHIRHKEIHEAVKKLIEKNVLKCKKLLFFDYIPGTEESKHDKNLKIPVATEKSDMISKLSDKLHMKKINLINEIYGFSMDSFEVRSSGKLEGFKIFK